RENHSGEPWLRRGRRLRNQERERRLLPPWFRRDLSSMGQRWQTPASYSCVFGRSFSGSRPTSEFVSLVCQLAPHRVESILPHFRRSFSISHHLARRGNFQRLPVVSLANPTPDEENHLPT